MDVNRKSFSRFIEVQGEEKNVPIIGCAGDIWGGLEGDCARILSI